MEFNDCIELAKEMGAQVREPSTRTWCFNQTQLIAFAHMCRAGAELKFTPASTEKPKHGQLCLVVTKSGRINEARFNEGWHGGFVTFTDSSMQDGVSVGDVVGWMPISKSAFDLVKADLDYLPCSGKVSKSVKEEHSTTFFIINPHTGVSETAKPIWVREIGRYNLKTDSVKFTAKNLSVLREQVSSHNDRFLHRSVPDKGRST